MCYAQAPTCMLPLWHIKTRIFAYKFCQFTWAVINCIIERRGEQMCKRGEHGRGAHFFSPVFVVVFSLFLYRFFCSLICVLCMFQLPCMPYWWIIMLHSWQLLYRCTSVIYTVRCVCVFSCNLPVWIYDVCLQQFRLCHICCHRLYLAPLLICSDHALLSLVHSWWFSWGMQQHKMNFHNATFART